LPIWIPLPLEILPDAKNRKRKYRHEVSATRSATTGRHQAVLLDAGTQRDLDNFSGGSSTLLLTHMSRDIEKHITAIERAFEIARSGVARNVDEIKKRLRDEGYDQDQIYGKALSRQLMEIARRAQVESKLKNTPPSGRAG
jgi:hypothetical protein